MVNYDYLCPIKIEYVQLLLLMSNYDWVCSIMIEYVDFMRFSRNFVKFIQNYMDINSPHRTILLYHGLGTGKTCPSLFIYNTLYN